MVGFCRLEILHFPLRCKQQHAAILAILRDGASAAERRNGLRRIRDPSRGGVACRLDLHVHAVLGPQPAGDHVELQRADDADDRLAPAARRRRTPASALLPRAASALRRTACSAVSCSRTRPKCSAGKRGTSGNSHRRAGVERVADGELSRVDEADDVAGVGDADRLAIAAEEPVGARRPDRSSRRGC